MNKTILAIPLLTLVGCNHTIDEITNPDPEYQKESINTIEVTPITLNPEVLIPISSPTPRPMPDPFTCENPELMPPPFTLSADTILSDTISTVIIVRATTSDGSELMGGIVKPPLPAQYYRQVSSYFVEFSYIFSYTVGNALNCTVEKKLKVEITPIH